MQLKAFVFAAIAAVASAAPEGDVEAQWWGCDSGAYDCTWHHGKHGWKVCDTNEKWQFAGFCPPKTKCYFNEENESPYCI